MIDLGIVKPGSTLYVPFQTFDSNDPSASVTITGLATTDVEVYKDGSVTQRASDSGYALLDTDGIDFDSTTGIHGVSIDLADNTTAGFWASGSQYWVVIASITVDAATINFIPVTFRIGYPSALLNTTIATLSSQTSFTLTSGPGDDDALNNCVLVAHDVASAVQTCIGYVSDYTGSTKTVTLATDPGIFTMAATDNIAIYPPSNVAAVATTAQTGFDINSLDTKLDDIQGATFNTSTDSLEALRDRGDAAWTGGATTTNSGTAQSGSTSTMVLESGASTTDDTYNGQVINITAGTGVGQSRAIGVYTGSSLTATVITNWATAPDNTSVYEIYPDDITEITAAPTAATIADAVWDEATAGHTSAGTFGEQTKNDIDAILADTAALQSDWADGGRLDVIIDAILVDTAEIGAAGAGLTAVPWNASWDAEVQSECADALTAYDPPTKAELDSGLAALNDLTAAQVNAEVDTALTDIHLDHLFAADYDPATKPGTATALLNELIEDDGGVSRFTSNALEQALQVTLTELTSLPGATPALADAVSLLYMALRNKRDTTATADEIHNNAGAVLATATLSDDATTFTKTKYS